MKEIELHSYIVLIYSNDQGKTWEESLVTEPFPVMRFRKVDFLNENFGYIIISGDRPMSQEASHVFLTHVGGKKLGGNQRFRGNEIDFN